MEFSILHLLMIIFIVLTTVWIFVNTIITKKWRNRAPGESDSWKLGVLYYNPEDTRMFLPKKTGLGFTINFARPISVMFTMLLILIVVLLAI